MQLTAGRRRRETGSCEKPAEKGIKAWSKTRVRQRSVSESFSGRKSPEWRHDFAFDFLLRLKVVGAI